MNQWNLLSETIIFAAYASICLALFRPRFSRKATAAAVGAAVAVIVGVSAALILSGRETLALSLLLLTAYLPFSAVLCCLAESDLPETAAVCMTGALGASVLKALDKLFPIVKAERAHEWMAEALLLAVAAALFVFTHRYVRKAFRACAIGGLRPGVTVFVPAATALLLISYFLNSTGRAPVLIMTMVIAIFVYLLIARLLAYYARLEKSEENGRILAVHMEAQRRDYEEILRKVESGRVYRHDMRHHLSVLEGLARQDDSPQILEYVNALSSSFSAAEAEIFCRNTTVNAILSNCIGRARSAGCQVTYKIVIPEELPFEEMDVCMLLANVLENAVNASEAMPEEERYLQVQAEFSDEKRLVLAVKNPCA